LPGTRGWLRTGPARSKRAVELEAGRWSSLSFDSARRGVRDPPLVRLRTVLRRPLSVLVRRSRPVERSAVSTRTAAVRQIAANGNYFFRCRRST
jgi:hypothetical protein